MNDGIFGWLGAGVRSVAHGVDAVVYRLSLLGLGAMLPRFERLAAARDAVRTFRRRWTSESSAHSSDGGPAGLEALIWEPLPSPSPAAVGMPATPTEAVRARVASGWIYILSRFVERRDATSPESAPTTRLVVFVPGSAR